MQRATLRLVLLLMVAGMILAGIPSVRFVAALEFPGSDALPVRPDSQASFEAWLSATGKPVRSRIHAYPACYAVYRDYNLLVYCSPEEVPGNRYDSQSGQYACLGYSYDEQPVTNSLFPDDSPDGTTRTSPWQWIELDAGLAGRISWARLNASEKEIIHASSLTYRNNGYGGMTFAALGLGEQTTVVLAPPSWHLGFALYTTHYLPGTTNNVRYATFNGNGGGDVQVACAVRTCSEPAADGKYVIGRNANTVSINYEISGWIESFQGLATELDINNCGVGNDQAWTAGSGTGPWCQTLTLQVSRADLGSAPERTFTLRGQAWVVSNLGDLKVATAEKEITVRQLPNEPRFSLQTVVTGSIHYFSGQTNSQGKILPDNPHRFLALERMKIQLDFTHQPGSMEIIFGQQRIWLNGIPGSTHYTASLIVPVLPSTLSWTGQRLTPPLALTVNAEDAGGTVKLRQEINDIEITGDIYDITYPLTGTGWIQ